MYIKGRWQSRRPGKAGINHVSTHLTIADNTSVETLVVRADLGDAVGVRVSLSSILNKNNKNLIKCRHQVYTFTFLLSDPSLLSWYQSIKATIHFDMSI